MKMIAILSIQTFQLMKMMNQLLIMRPRKVLKEKERKSLHVATKSLQESKMFKRNFHLGKSSLNLPRKDHLIRNFQVTMAKNLFANRQQQNQQRHSTDSKFAMKPKE